jgi:hypothetical protein
VLGCLLWGVPAVSFAQRPQTQSEPDETTILTPDEETAELEEEVGDRDLTYIRTRLVFRYDHKRLEAPASGDRFRVRLLYAFGPKQRYGASVLMPLVQADTPVGSARGSGDAELQLTANIAYSERFRTGVGIQATLQTSSDALLGGATTTIKPDWSFTGVLSSRAVLTAAFFYKQSIHTTRGVRAKQFEPDVTVNARAMDATWFLEWDSYYDFLPDRFAQTLKPGVSRAFGSKGRWVASAYYAFGINDYGRRSQYRYNAGADVTWYPRKYR